MAMAIVEAITSRQQQEIGGSLITPEDLGYAQARKAWNADIDGDRPPSCHSVSVGSWHGNPLPARSMP